MMKGREHSAERLSDIVSLIRARRQTGLLSVERFENGQFEEGEIYFENGQPVLARRGNLPHAQALSRLLGWGKIYFSFTKNVAAPVGDATQAEAANFQWSPVREQSSLRNNRLASSGPLSPSPGTPDPLLSRRNDYHSGDITTVVPRRLVFEQNVLSLPLTRTQRSMYLLIDGHRTLADIARCTQKNVQEIYKIVQELQARNFVDL